MVFRDGLPADRAPIPVAEGRIFAWFVRMKGVGIRTDRVPDIAADAADGCDR